MSDRPRRYPSASTGLAVGALVVSLSGTAVAATAAANGDKLIKQHSLSGNRLRNNTVTGKQLKESTLAKVPAAKHADTANSAQHADTAQTAATAAALPPLTWTDLNLVNDWVKDMGDTTPAVAKDAQGIVHLSGSVKPPLSGDTDAITVLPAGYRPAHRTWLPVLSTNLDGLPRPVAVIIETNGGMTPVYSTGSTGSFISFDGLTFPAA